MEKPQPEMSLDDVLITEALQHRMAHAPNWQAEVEAMRALTQQLSQPPAVLLQSLVEQLITLCRAGSAGVSLLELTPAGATGFRVGALTGALTQSIDGTVPSGSSPSGVCLERGVPILYDRPSRYFTHLQAIPIPLVEGLILPLIVEGQGIGTIWMFSHDDQGHFDAEDLRVMTGLSHLAVAALSLHQQSQPSQLQPELQGNQQQLQERTKLLERAEQIGGLGHWTYDLRTQEMFWSAQARQIYVGDAEFELTYENAANLVHPDDLPGLLAAVDIAVAQRQMLEAECRIVRPDGSEGTVYLNADLDFDAAGQPSRMFGIVQDITEARQRAADQQWVEAALRKSEARFRVLGESLPLIVSLAQPDGQIEYINPYWTQFSGRTPAEFMTGDWLTAIHPDDQPMILERWQQAVAQGIPYEYEFRARSADGSYRWLLARGRPVEQNGEMTNWVNFALDIHDRRQAEEALRESETRLQSIANLVPDLLWDSEPDGWTNWYNQRWMAYTGQTFEQAIGWGWIDAIHPDDRATSTRCYQEAVQQGVQLQLEHRIRRSDGEYRWFVVKAAPLKDEGGRVVKMYSAAADIHDQRIALEALRESEERFRTLADTAPALIWFNDAQGENRFINQHFLDFTGKSAEQIRGEGWHELVHPDEAEAYIADYLAAVREQRPWHHRNRIRRYDGVWRWHDNDARPLFSDDGVYLGHVGITIDNTDVIEAEITLRESEAKYRSLFDSMDEGYLLCEVIFDENEKPIDIFFLEANPAAIRLAGRDFSGRRMREIDPNYEEYWYELYGRVAITGVAIREERYAEPHGRWFDFYTFKVDERESRRVATVFKDITDRKQAEAQLQRVAERDAFRVELSDALRSLTDPGMIQQTACLVLGEHLKLDWVLYSEVNWERHVLINKQEYYWGTSRRDDLPSLIGEYDMSVYPVHVEAWSAGRPVVVNDLENDSTLSEGERVGLTMYGIRAALSIPLIKNGTAVVIIAAMNSVPRQWIEEEIALLQETAERTWEAVQRALAEANLRESEAKYRTLFDSIDEGLAITEMIYDDQGEIVDIIFRQVNRAYERHGHVYNVVGRSIFDVISGVEDYWLDLYKRVARTGESVREENYQQDVDRWFDVYFSRVDDNGRFVAIVFSDISERKRREQQQAFLLTFSDTLRALADEKAIEETGVRMLAEFLRLDRAYIFVLYPSEDRAVVRAEQRKENLASLVGEVRMSDFPETVRQIENETLVINDIDSDARLSDLNRASLDAVNLQSFVCASVRKGERNVIWSLAASTTVPRTWTKAELELIETVAERMWAAVERAKAEKALREAELQRVREQSAREQEHQRAETLAELDRTKTAFFSNISHEFRTPLTLTLGPLEEALASVEEWVSEWMGESAADHPSTHLPAHLKDQLELAYRNSLRLLKLVNTLLDFSRIEADRLQVRYQPTDLSVYTAQLASVFRSTIETAGLQFVVDCAPLPEPVYVDRAMWEKIVLNLISNAFKFTFEGEIRVSLHWVAGERVGEWVNCSADVPSPTHARTHLSIPHVILQVSDTGVGIPATDLPHLFERFYQVKGTRGRSYEGSGIGLSLVQELVKQQGGSISVTSTLNQGSCFTVTLPVGTAHLPADQIEVATAPSSVPSVSQSFVAEAERWQTQPPQTASDQSLTAEVSDFSDAPISASEILLVDDNVDMCSYIQNLLDSHYRTRVATTGTAALLAIQQSHPDLVLTDVMMPEMDGFELLRRLRADPQTQNIPVILLSAQAGEAAKLAGLATGADDYLVKPFSARELLARIDATLKLTQMRREAAQREQQMQTVQQLNEELEQQVNARTAQLAAVNQELEAFASAIAHDLRVPLNYIKTFTRRLRGQLDSSLLSSSAVRTFNIIEQAATQSETMVVHLLEFSRLGRATLQKTAVDLNDSVENVLNQLQIELAGRTVHWQIDSLPVVTGDPVLLQMVLQNLLSNAVKYTRQRTEARITIGCFEQGQEVVIFVQDNGAGFDMRGQDRLFSLFQRLHPQEEFAGTGVGLATVRRIIHRHGGRTWAEGAIDQGATFYFSLPQHEVSA